MFLLSIGHNQEEKGATNKEHNEFDIASRWVKRIQDIIDIPIEIVPGGSLKEKVEFINNHEDVQFAAELHFNSNIEDAKGSESLYYPGSKPGKRYAEMIQDEFEKRGVFQPNRGVKEGYYYKDGEKQNILYFLRATRVPSVIIEPEFISQPKRIEKHFFEGCDSIAQASTRFYKYINEQ